MWRGTMKKQWLIVLVILVMMITGCSKDEEEYTVTFHLEGGSYNNQMDTFTITADEAAAMMPIPQKTGYAFKGWVYSYNRAKLYQDTDLFERDTIFYARWEIMTYELAAYQDNKTLVDTVEVTYDGRLTPFQPIEGYINLGWYLDADLTEMFEDGVMPAKDVTLYGDYHLIDTLDEVFDAPDIDSSSTDLTLHTSDDIVYLMDDMTWQWTIDLTNQSTQPIQLHTIERFDYTLDQEHQLTNTIDETELINEFTTVTIQPNETFGFDFSKDGSFNPSLIFSDYVVTSETSDGTFFQSHIRVYFSRDSHPGYALSFKNVNYFGEFSLPITNKVNWRPVNVLGLPNTSKERLLELKGNPEALQSEIDSLYEALLYLHLSDWAYEPVTTVVSDNNLDWRYYGPAEIVIQYNKGTCVGVANFINYVLKDDYDEVGYILMYYVHDSNHVINYILQDGVYYTIDGTAFLNHYDVTGFETGLMDDYIADHPPHHLHESQTLDDYLDYYQTKTIRPAGLFLSFTATNLYPYTVFWGELNYRRIVFPNDTKNNITIIYDNPSDVVHIDFKEGPTNYPYIYDPYNMYE